MERSKKRFGLIYTQGVSDNIGVLVDKETGVNYININGGGITPLIDSEGKPIVTKIKE